MKGLLAQIKTILGPYTNEAKSHLTTDQYCSLFQSIKGYLKDLGEYNNRQISSVVNEFGPAFSSLSLDGAWKEFANCIDEDAAKTWLGHITRYMHGK